MSKYSNMVSVRFGIAEQKQLCLMANERGMSLSQFIRTAVFEKITPRSADIASFTETITCPNSGISLEFDPNSLDFTAKTLAR